MLNKNKYFSVEEANEVVPILLADVPLIQELMGDLAHKYPDVNRLSFNSNNYQKLVNYFMTMGFSFETYA